MRLQRKSGVLVHPTSFPSSYGIGDLGNGAYNFVDFLHRSKQKLWQILPLNPTSFGDSPYQSFSTFAGNYLLISPDILVEEGYLSNNDIKDVPAFNSRKINYGNVINYKNTLFKQAYEKFKSKATFTQKNNFEKFCKKNASWLDDYTLFISLKQNFIEKRRNTYQTPEYKEYYNKNIKFMSENSINDCFYGAVWSSWPKEIALRNKNSIKEWSITLKESIEYEKFLQYEFFRQWINIKNYANKRGIDIIGDIPIFVALDSCDVWSNSKLFYLDEHGRPTVVAGVPPDDFTEQGQLWGNPLYNWQENKKEGYKWWLQRITEILKIIDIVRIDHFKGFESYWSVKYGEDTAINGRWEKGVGRELFDFIEKKLGKLPIIVEDLGFVTKEVEDLRDGLGLPGMKILQFAFDKEPNNNYIPHLYTNSNCIVYTGTHDNETAVQWYQNAPEKNKDYFRRYLNTPGNDPSWDLIRLAFSSVAAYAVIPIQDIMGLGEEDRMNLPGIASGNWQFRYTEEMLADDLVYKLSYLTDIFHR